MRNEKGQGSVLGTCSVRTDYGGSCISILHETYREPLTRMGNRNPRRTRRVPLWRCAPMFAVLLSRKGELAMLLGLAGLPLRKVASPRGFATTGPIDRKYFPRPGCGPIRVASGRVAPPYSSGASMPMMPASKHAASTAGSNASALSMSATWRA